MKMKKYLNLLKGKKTYIGVATTFIAGGMTALGYPVPEELVIFLAGAGLYYVRKTSTQSEEVADDTLGFVKSAEAVVKTVQQRQATLQKPSLKDLKSLVK